MPQQMIDKQTYKLTVLTPVHIGSGEGLEYQNRLILNNHCYVIDNSYTILEQSNKAMQYLTQKSGLLGVDECFKDPDIVKYLKAATQDVLAMSANLTPRDLKLSSKAFEPTYGIMRHSYDPLTSLPIIPGSSIKGALRTGFLNKLFKPELHNRFDRNLVLEKELLNGSFNTDPFSLVSISDAIAKNHPHSFLAIPQNRHCDGSLTSLRDQNQSIYQFLLPGTQFCFSICKKPNFIYDLFKAKEFFHRMYEFNRSKYQNVLIDKIMTELDQLISNIKHNDKACLLKIGRFSGADDVSIHSKSRKYKTKHGDKVGNDEKSHPNSLNYTTINETILPCGYVLLEKYDAEENIVMHNKILNETFENVRMNVNDKLKEISESKYILDQLAKKHEDFQRQRTEEIVRKKNKERADFLEQEKEKNMLESLDIIGRKLFDLEKSIDNISKTSKVSINHHLWQKFQILLKDVLASSNLSNQEYLRKLVKNYILTDVFDIDKKKKNELKRIFEY